jgi:hypothetical protein
MSFFTKPIAGLRPADSITISLATAIGVAAIYAQGVGPVSDVHMTQPGDGAINSSIRKAGWKSILLVTGVTLLSRDLNVVLLGGGMIIYDHIAYLHADMASPANGEIAASPEAYQPAAPGASASFQLSAVS